MSQSTEAVRARAARRRHLQQRQTVIFGTLVAALLVIGLLGGAVETKGMPKKVEKAMAKMRTTASAKTSGRGRNVTRRCKNPATASQVMNDQVSSGSHAQ